MLTRVLLQPAQVPPRSHLKHQEQSRQRQTPREKPVQVHQPHGKQRLAMQAWPRPAVHGGNQDVCVPKLVQASQAQHAKLARTVS